MEINKTGVWGEIYAARHLRTKGYRIITSNYRTRMGEIDIVATKGKYICFVEVKTRGENPIAQPMEAVDTNKQQRLLATARIFMQNTDYGLQPRFDVCEVWLDGNFKQIKLNYLENAYGNE